MDFTIGGKSSSPKTFDAGVGIYAVTAVLSMTGMAWTAKSVTKRKKKARKGFLFCRASENPLQKGEEYVTMYFVYSIPYTCKRDCTAPKPRQERENRQNLPVLLAFPAAVGIVCIEPPAAV